MRGVDLSYFLRRIGMFFLVIFVAASFNFLIPRLAPGDPLDAVLMRMTQSGMYLENQLELIEFYRERNKLVTINAEGSIDEVGARVWAVVRDLAV